MRDVVIIGAGISGLAAARMLAEHELTHVVVERGAELPELSPGGKLRSVIPPKARTIHWRRIVAALEESGSGGDSKMGAALVQARQRVQQGRGADPHGHRREREGVPHVDLAQDIHRPPASKQEREALREASEAAGDSPGAAAPGA